MNKLSNYKKELVIFFLSFLSLIYSFFLNEDGTGGGAKGDFEATYGFILALQENLLANPKEWTLVHTPLHFLILSLITKLIHDPYILRLIFASKRITLMWIGQTYIWSVPRRSTVSYVAPMSYRVHVPYMYCIDLHVPVLYMYVSTVDLVVDLV